MKLYHGSNVPVTEPKIIVSDRKLDFGSGFYVTSDFEQAKRWAEIKTKRKESGVPTVTVYDFDEDATQKLSVRIFDSPSAEWLKYASENRLGILTDNDNDMVIGPVANDKTAPVISLYFSGIFNEEEAIKRLLPQKLKDQYVFKTQASLCYLHFCEVAYFG